MLCYVNLFTERTSAGVVIKADRPLTHDTLNAPLLRLLTDNSNGLVMVIRNYHWLNSASPVLINIDLPCTTDLSGRFSLFDLDL